MTALFSVFFLFLPYLHLFVKGQNSSGDSVLSGKSSAVVSYLEPGKRGQILNNNYYDDDDVVVLLLELIVSVTHLLRQ